MGNSEEENNSVLWVFKSQKKRGLVGDIVFDSFHILLSAPMSGPPVLGLKMKNLPMICSVESQPCSNVVETVVAMTLQDSSSYNCGDYLARRSARERSSKSHEIEDGDECPVLVAEDAVDAVCRERMCEWTYRVCDHFKTGREIVAVSFSYLDRFVDRCNCDRTAFKLAAMTSLYMATKIFNTRKITLRNLVELSRGEFEEHHIIKMEVLILQTLGWSVHPPTIQCFIEPFCAALTIADRSIVDCIRQRAIFFAELALYDYYFVSKEKPIVAVAAILNAIEGLEESSETEARQCSFVALLEKSFEVHLDSEKLESVRHRLWYVYSMSAQCQDDEVTSIKEAPGSPKRNEEKNNICGPVEHSPVCVTST